MLFEWDETKNHQNQHKHGIAFGLAQEVFLDPLRITMETQDVDGEERFVTIGSYHQNVQTHGGGLHSEVER
jgi:uncharacterized DUF497 family protein